MLRLRLLSAAFIAAALVVASCDGSGEHDTPDEANQEASGAASAGTVVLSTLPPAGTGSDPDSAAPGAVGQSQGATPGSPNPADAVQSGVASDSSL